MTDPRSPSDVPPPVTHRAPPADERTRSPLGTGALVLTVVFLALSMLTGFVWLWAVPAAVFAAWAMFRINPALQKGHGLALLGLVLAVLGGLGAYGCSSWVQGKAELLGKGVLAAAASRSAPERLDGWLTPEAEEAGLADVIRQRYQAVVDLVGPYQKELVEPSLTHGSRPYVVPPTGVVEVGQKIGEAQEIDPAALWVRARFRDEVIHVRIQWAHDDVAAVQRLEGGGPQHEYRVVKDVRFFRDKTAAGEAPALAPPSDPEPASGD